MSSASLYKCIFFNVLKTQVDLIIFSKEVLDQKSDSGSLRTSMMPFWHWAEIQLCSPPEGAQKKLQTKWCTMGPTVSLKCTFSMHAINVSSWTQCWMSLNFFIKSKINGCVSLMSPTCASLSLKWHKQADKCPPPPMICTCFEKISYSPKRIVGNLQKILGRYGQR